MSYPNDRKKPRRWATTQVSFLEESLLAAPASLLLSEIEVAKQRLRDVAGQRALVLVERLDFPVGAQWRKGDTEEGYTYETDSPAVVQFTLRAEVQE